MVDKVVSKSKLHYTVNAKTILWVMFVWVGLITAAWSFSHIYGRSVLPVYIWTIENISNNYQIQSLRIESQGEERVFRFNALTTGARQIGNGAVPDGISLSSSTLLAHALQHVIVLYTILLIWPVATVWKKLALFTLSLPFLFLVEALDVPLVLLGSMDDLMLFNFIPAAMKSSFFINWMNIMNSGGRLALSLIAAVTTIIAWQYLCMYLSRSDVHPSGTSEPGSK